MSLDLGSHSPPSTPNSKLGVVYEIWQEEEEVRNWKWHPRLHIGQSRIRIILSGSTTTYQDRASAMVGMNK